MVLQWVESLLVYIAVNLKSCAHCVNVQAVGFFILGAFGWMILLQFSYLAHWVKVLLKNSLRKK